MSTIENKNRASNTFRNSHCEPHHSQWLRNTLSDLDEKIMALITIIQEEDDSSIHRDKIYQKKTQQLIKMGEEFHKSYHLFSEGYDKLSSELSEPIQSKSLFSMNSYSRRSSEGVIGSSVVAKPETLDTLPEVVVEFDYSKFGPESPNYAIDDQSPTEEINPILKSRQETGVSQVEEGECKVIRITEVKNVLGSNCRGTTRDFPMDSFELSLQVLKLITENQSQQAELIRRNEAKKEIIKDLYCKLDRFMNENKVLHDQLRSSKHGVNKNQSKLSKLKRLVLRKFLVALTAYSHPRHLCAKFPYHKSPHETYCNMLNLQCYCT
ncbi:hypothetical protein NE237_028691 [Protea cynaroides]|uniref:NAB domain-containing protein n=1 Tax=Protea cynaroides TaxID=273540 RepID=A0A9Q0JT43_9MAGN|nr:hypothetical protein NE237_028691 [Protea cynaroides]